MNKSDARLQVGRNRFFFIFFVSGACPELLPKGIKTKEKHTAFELFNLRELFRKLH